MENQFFVDSEHLSPEALAKKNRNTQKIALSNDRIHLNDKGAFLQGCVWYMVLFDAKASDIKLPYRSPDTKLLIKCAEEAVAALKK